MPERVSCSPQETTKNTYLNNEGRPDIIICDTGNLSDQEIDISLAHPWSKVVVKNWAKLSGFAAKKREEMKMINTTVRFFQEVMHPSALRSCS